MTCEQYEEQTSALLDQELTDEEAGDLYLHLSGCAACRRSLQTGLTVREGLQEDTAPTAPVEMDRRILQAVHTYRPDRKPVRQMMVRGRITLPLPLAAAFAVLLIVGSLVLSLAWPGEKIRGDSAKVQTVFLSTVPTVEVRAYSLNPVSAIQ